MRRLLRFMSRISPTASGVILLLAVTAKVATLWTEPNFNMLVLGLRSLTIVILHVEVIVAIGLLFTSWREMRRAALLLHFVFMIYGIISIASGRNSCGCFGNWTPASEWIVIINLSLIVALASNEFAGDSATSFRSLRWKSNGIKASGLAVLLSALIFLPILRMHDSIFDICDRLSNGQTTILRPKEWQGKKLPILGCLVGSVEGLTSGRCSVLIPVAVDCASERRRR